MIQELVSQSASLFAGPIEAQAFIVAFFLIGILFGFLVVFLQLAFVVVDILGDKLRLRLGLPVSRYVKWLREEEKNNAD